MITFESFEDGLQDSLNHLYDPAYDPPEIICTVLGLAAPGAARAAQTALQQAIEALAPTPQVPASARSRRVYDVLACRYLQKLTQDEAAERLGITPRHLRREQSLAVSALARLLWERYRDAPPPARQAAGQEGPAPAPTQSPEWLSQVRQELDALEKGSQGDVASVGDVLAGLVHLVAALAARRDVALALGQVQPSLAAAIHPSKLRQALLHSLTGLIRGMPPGRVEIMAHETGGLVAITLTALPAPTGQPPDDELVRELLADHQGAIERRSVPGGLELVLMLAAAPKITVLVVDDNADLMHFYRRYVQGTRYHIVPFAQGTDLFETIQAARPAIIVLDVMLPDMDGWELLVHLHNHPATRAIPVILCSVVREEELALALGAALYVPKPVRRQDFIQALDQALAQAQT